MAEQVTHEQRLREQAELSRLAAQHEAFKGRVMKASPAELRTLAVFLAAELTEKQMERALICTDHSLMNGA